MRWLSVALVWGGFDQLGYKFGTKGYGMHSVAAVAWDTHGSSDIADASYRYNIHIFTKDVTDFDDAKVYFRDIVTDAVNLLENGS